jgi:hypothetical protein
VLEKFLKSAIRGRVKKKVFKEEGYGDHKPTKSGENEQLGTPMLNILPKHTFATHKELVNQFKVLETRFRRICEGRP